MLQRLGFPSVGRHRRFVTAIAIDAVGSGVFMPISILYFLVATDLSLVQVGAAISLASLISLPAGPMIGSVPGEREKWFGFLGALRNIGFALGGLLSGLAITLGTQTAYAAVVVANAASYASRRSPSPGCWTVVSPRSGWPCSVWPASASPGPPCSVG